MNLFLDFETTAEDDNKMSINPWKDCKILGFSYAFDYNEPTYVPVRHRGNQKEPNVSVEEAHAKLRDLFSKATHWVNHNIKYDAHVLYNETGIDFKGTYVDSLTVSKLCDKNERFTYNLTDLMREWYDTDIEPYEIAIKKYIKKDYGVCPIDIMAEYANIDVKSVQTMHKSWDTMITSRSIMDLEIQVTRRLIELERRGILVDSVKAANDYAIYCTMLDALYNQASDIAGFGFRPHTNADCYLYFIIKNKLPVLEYTEKDKQPSFGKEAIQAYKRIPGDHHTMCDIVLLYQQLQKLTTSFLGPYLEKEVNGRLHANYNQCVRTGRMSCSDPNMQQVNDTAAEYLIPGEGRQFIEFDFSQIEFRVIVHYIEDQKCIYAYRQDPKTDFHVWVAEMCEVDRIEAKTINFMLGYGGGRDRCIRELRKQYITSNVTDAEMDQRGTVVYTKYHRTLPTLLPTRDRAMSSCNKNGYVKTLFGRKRFLDSRYSYKAFNTACQGTAADLMKQKTLALCNALDAKKDCYLEAIVHDSWLINVPEGETLNEITEILSDKDALSVPVTVSKKIYKKNWRN